MLVSAPAGFGKTALLAQWAASPQGRSEPLAWLSLDSEDSDPVRFWSQVTQALREMPLNRNVAFASGSWHFDDSIALVRSEQPPSWQYLLAVLHSEISTIPERFTLILDNYQVIQDDIVHQGLARLVEHLSKQARIILATRKDPPLPLSHWRSKSYLSEIRLTDLRFTHEESIKVFNQAIRPVLSPESVALLAKHAEGWITGILLAACALQNQAESVTAGYIAEFISKQEAVLEHLVDTVLLHYPEAVRIFLLQTSILDTITTDLADAVLVDAPPIRFDQPAGLDTSRGVLDFLETHFPFIQALDEQHTGYAYQPFIRGLLESHLQSVRPGLTFWLHRRASEWYDARGMTPEAVRHARFARDYEQAADIMEQAVRSGDAWTDREVINNLEWLKQLPERSLSARPWLRLLISRARSQGEQMQEGANYLSQLEQATIQMPDSVQEAGRLLGLIYEARASLAVLRGDTHIAVRYAQRALDNIPKEYPLAISRANLALGASFAQLGDMSRANQVYAQGTTNALSNGYRFIAIQSAFFLAEIQVAQGQLSQALLTCEKSSELGTFANQPAPQLGWNRLVQAKVAYQRNSLPEAERLTKEGIELLQRGEITAQNPDAYALLALICQTRGDIEGANVAIQTALQRAFDSQIPQTISLVSAYQARIWLAQHDYLRAFPWADKYRATAKPDYLRDFEDLTLVRSLLVNQQAEEALSRLDALLSQTKTSGKIARMIEVLALRALALQTINNPAKALDNLGQAIFLAEPENSYRVFLNEGEAMQLMILALYENLMQPESLTKRDGLESLVADGSQESVTGPAGVPATGLPEGERFNRLIVFIEKILAAFPQIPGYPTHAESLPEGQSEPLNPREEAILGMLARGLSNREISQKLFLSTNTLRAYTVSLFSKLGVNSRSDAVARARQSGLLPPREQDP